MPTSPFVALRALLRAPRFLSREILTFHRRLSASLLHHGPPPATPRPMTYHPRDNATAHGPPPTRQRPTASDETTQRPRPTASGVPPTRQRHTASDAAPTTQPRQRCRGARAKLTAPPDASAVTHAAQRRSSGRGHHQHSPAPSHTTDAAAPARDTTAATPPATQHHTTSHGRPSKASGRHNPTPRHTNAATRGAEQSTIAPPSTTGPLGYTTTPRTSSMTRRNPTRV